MLKYVRREIKEEDHFAFRLFTHHLSHLPQFYPKIQTQRIRLVQYNKASRFPMNFEGKNAFENYKTT